MVLSFGIQREANYYRQPALSYEQGQAKDILIGLTHFTSAFLLLILATLCSMLFGFLLPLLALAGWSWALARSWLAAGGLVAALILVAGYFLDELVHYRILSIRLVNDAREWGGESVIAISAIVLALGVALLVCLCLKGAA